MNIKARILLFATVIILIIPFVFDFITVKDLSWESVQKYGGVKIGQPLSTQSGFYMPIICNVSGMDSITVKPEALSSANVCKRTVVKIKGKNIFISIKVSFPLFKDETCLCKAVKLGQLDRGHYKIFYLSGEFIGEFDI